MKLASMKVGLTKKIQINLNLLEIWMCLFVAKMNNCRDWCRSRLLVQWLSHKRW